MPNWCTTDYVAFGGKEDIEKLKKKLDDAFNTECRIKNDFGNWWLGNVLDLHGLDWKKFDCRGEITQLTEAEHDFYEEGKSHFMFQTWTAWGPCHEAFEAIKGIYPEVELYWLAEEPGCGFLETNDVSGIFHPERVKLRVTEPDGDIWEEYYSSEEELLETLNKAEKYSHDKCTTLQEFLDEMDRTYGEENPYEIDFVSIRGE